MKKIPVAISKLSSLQSLDLSHNLLTTLKDSNLEKLIFLQNLNLSCNRLVSKNSLPLEIVASWKCMKSLNLSCNWFRKEFPVTLFFIGSTITSVPLSIEDHIFVDNNPLLELDFSYNMIQILQPQFIQAFPNLKVLKLAGNNIVKLPSTIIDLMQQLEVFDIRGNRIRGTVGSNMEVMVSTAPVESSDALSSETASPIFSEGDDFNFKQNDSIPSNNLKKLFLDNNHISDVKLNQRFENLISIVSHRNPSLLQIAFSQHMISLTTLVLSYSRLAFLPDALFTYTPYLKVLILNNNQLTMLPPSVESLQKLIRLDLAENSITKLPACIREWKSLEILNLRGNNLKELPAELWLLSVRFLNLSSNTIEVWPEIPVPQAADQSTNNRGSSFIGNRARPMSIVASATTESISTDLPIGADVTKSRRRGSIVQSTQSNQNSFLGGIMPLSTSLQWLSIADNRLESSFFETAIFNMISLRYLNVSHNEIFSIPNGTLRNSSPSIEELYLSGNHLTQLPDEVHVLKKLKRFYLNNNRIGSIPPELGKLSNLKQLDVGRNQLRYNVSNWPYDWNWNWNTDLHYLNLSGNPKLEIRSNAPLIGLNTGKKGAPAQLPTDRGDIARFDSLKKLRSLGLMEVNLGVPVPDESETLRIRVYAAGGASPNWRKHLGGNDGNVNASPDVIPPVPKLPESSATSMGVSVSSAPIVLVPNESVLNTVQLISYGVADYLDLEEKNSSWDLVIVGAKIMQNAKDELKMAELKSSEDSPVAADSMARVPRMRANTFKKRVGECVFGMFDGGNNGYSWCSKTLNDFFMTKFSTELKKMLKDSTLVKRPTSVFVGDMPVTDSDSQIIENSLKRTFLALNKYLGDLYYKTKYKSKDSKDTASEDTTKSKQPSRKQSVNFETSLSEIKPRKSGRKSIAPPVDDDDIQNTLTAIATELAFNQDEFEQGFDDYFNDHPRPDSSEEPYLRLQSHGYSALVAYVYNSQIYIANVGDSMAVISRNGVAVPVSIKHTAFNFQTIVCKPQVTANEANMNKDGQKKDSNVPKETAEKAGLAARMDSQNMFRAKKDLYRIRETGDEVGSDSMVGGKTVFTRAFGYFEQAPQINAKPDIVTIDLTDQDEFLIIGTGSFWSNIQYQTAVDVARSKADDALEAALVLRDFAVAYTAGGSYIEDEDAEFVDEKYVLRSKFKMNLNEKRFRRQDAMSVMVINLRDFMNSSANTKRKAFNKIKRKRDENADSGISRLAPEVEPPTGNVAIVFTDVRNSTSLWERMPIAMRVAIKEHNQIMRKNLRKFSGYEVKTEGDAFMVAFRNVIDAMGWCTAVQLQLLEADWPQEILEAVDGQEIRGPASLDDGNLDFNQSSLLYRGLSVRMGIHFGTPVSEVDPVTRRMDYFGPMVNKTSRISSSAEGGQIIISTDVERAFRKQKLQFVKEDEMSVDGKETLVFSYDPKDSVNGQKTPGIFNVEPVLIHVGEKKLKGFEAPELLISLFPKALVGRHRMGPPSLPGAEHAPFDNSKVEHLLNTKPAETPTSEMTANSSRESISSQNSAENPVAIPSSMPRSIHSKFKLSALADINEEELSRSSEFRVPSLRDIPSTSHDTSDEARLHLLCRRVEKVAFDLVKSFIAELLDEEESRNILDLHNKVLETNANATESIARLERAASAIAFVKTSTIVQDVRTKSREEQLDFGHMLVMLLSQN